MLSLNKQKISFLLVVIFALVITIEYSTPSKFLFSYLYTGVIILANYSFSRRALLWVTIASVILTLLNLVVPSFESDITTWVNRLVAAIALLVTGILCLRNRYYSEAIARQQAQIRTQEKLASIREDFVSTLTHDLKTPLLGAIETLKAFKRKEFGAITPMQERVIDMMTRSHVSSLELVHTLLDIYRNDTEGIKLKLESVNLATIVEEVIATLIDLAASRRVSISLNYGISDFRQALWVNGDKIQLQRVFSNLIINAINHSPRGSKIEVVLESTGSEQQVTVLDLGEGIPPEELPHLFERFYQGSSSRDGSGLGLYLSRQIIEAHNGKIWAKNRTPFGAIFACQLPIYNNE